MVGVRFRVRLKLGPVTLVVMEILVQKSVRCILSGGCGLGHIFDRGSAICDSL